jgi:SpoIID/LytB domain protein
MRSPSAWTLVGGRSLAGGPLVQRASCALMPSEHLPDSEGVRARTAIAATLALALSPASSASGTTLVIDGAGDGHGVGMSQEGALGLAEHGWSYQAILAHYYAGTALGQAPADARVRVLQAGGVRTIPLERYVRGVVAAEMPAGWPAAALRAQAVASRTYALTAHAGGSRFDVYADTRSQVYRGAAAETARTNAAVAATAGEIVVYGAHPRPAITYFFASSGGATENIENAFPGSAPAPWLRGVADPFDQGSLHRWRLSLSFAAAGTRLRGIVKGAFRGIEVLRRGASPRIVSARVLGSAGASTIGGAELAARLGLYDTWAYFSVRDGPRLTREPDRSGRASPPPVESQAPGGVPPEDASPAPPEDASPAPPEDASPAPPEGASPEGRSPEGASPEGPPQTSPASSAGAAPAPAATQASMGGTAAQ